MKTLLTSCLAVCWFSLAGQGQTILYVDPGATNGLRNGLSWGNAFLTIDEALSYASAPAQIWLKQGTYRPPLAPGFDRGVPFVMKDGVDIYGGFAGTESSLGQRDVAAHPTIISGDVRDNDATFGNTDNAINLIQVAGGTITLDGLTLRDAYGGYAVDQSGGTLTLRNCTLENNHAGGGFGKTVGSTTIQNCLVQQNDSYAIATSSPSNGTYGTATTVESCLIQSNSLGGGVAISLIDTNVTVAGCEFTSNLGTALFAEPLGNNNSATNGTVQVSGCRFVDNSEGLELQGYAPFRVSNCEFRGNHSTTATRSGGITDLTTALGGVSNEIANCSFVGNSSAFQGTSGGALSLDVGGYKATAVINCSFLGNQKLGGYGGAGAVWVGTSFPGRTNQIINCVMWNNEVDGSTNVGNASLGLGNNSQVIIGHSLIQNLNAVGVANLDGTNPANDPLLVDAGDPTLAPSTNGNPHLLAGSPALDVGDNTAITLTNDLAGNPRILNGTVDLGAYEAHPEPFIVVLDGNNQKLANNGPTIDLGVRDSAGGAFPLTFTIQNSESLVVLSSLAVTVTNPVGGTFVVSPPPAASIPANTNTTFTLTITSTNPGPLSATLLIASDDPNNNPFVISLAGQAASSALDSDHDGLSDYYELTHNTDPLNPDTDGDGVSDGAEVALAAYGFLNGVDDSARLAALQSSATAVGLYTASDLQALALGRPVLSRNSGTGKFTLGLGVLGSTNAAGPFTTFTNVQVEFDPPNPGAYFLQVFGNAP